MVLILECMIICFILLVPCVVAIANGIHNAAFLFERDVQDRVVEMGLTTREHLDRNKKRFKYTTLLIMVAFAIWAVYGIDGARGFWNPFWQIYALVMAEGLFDRFFIDWYWVGHTKAWTIPGTEAVYTKKDFDCEVGDCHYRQSRDCGRNCRDYVFIFGRAKCMKLTDSQYERI